MYAVNKHEEKCDKKKSIKIKVVSQKEQLILQFFSISMKILILLWMLSLQSDVAGSIFVHLKLTILESKRQNAALRS